MERLGLFMFFMGVVFYLIGAFMIMIEEFRVSLGWGLACLIIQPLHFVFIVVHFDKCRRHLLNLCIGLLFLTVGGVMAMGLTPR